MPFPPYPAVQADLESRYGVAEIARWSKSETDTPDPAKVLDAIGQAWSAFDSAARNIFTAASINALTSETLPGEAKTHIVSHAIDILSAGSARDAEIEKKAGEAKEWRAWLVGGTVRAFDDVLTKVGSATGADMVRISAPTQASRLNDPTNLCSPMMWRDPPL